MAGSWVGTALPLGEPAERFELIEEGLPGRGGGLARQQIPDVEEDLHHQLIALVGGIEFLHPARLFGPFGGVEGRLIDRLEIAEDRIARAHTGRIAVGQEGMVGR